MNSSNVKYESFTNSVCMICNMSQNLKRNSWIDYFYVLLIVLRARNVDYQFYLFMASFANSLFVLEFCRGKVEKWRSKDGVVAVGRMDPERIRSWMEAVTGLEVRVVVVSETVAREEAWFMTMLHYGANKLLHVVLGLNVPLRDNFFFSWTCLRSYVLRFDVKELPWNS